MIEPVTVTMALNWLTLAGKAASGLGLIFGVFKVIGWIKTKFISINDNVLALKTSMDANFNGLKEEIKNQTNTLATALSEQRQDFRTFYAPTLLMMQQQQSQPIPVRAKRAVKKPIKRK